VFQIFPGLMIEEWLRSPRKYGINGSIGWKAMMESYPMLGEWVFWKIGSGKKVRIGEDPWVNFRP
jgi:hypothetical protein